MLLLALVTPGFFLEAYNLRRAASVGQRTAQPTCGLRSEAASSQTLVPPSLSTAL